MPLNAAVSPEMQAAADQELCVVLKPISHAELGDIVIENGLFAIGRTEAPFGSYRPEIVAGLSRRHARIFLADGAVYVADLDSKNGTTVNRVRVQEKPTSLRDGDEICFGGDLSYRVRLGGRTKAPRRVAKLLSLTLNPARSDLGLQAIVLAQFPFLIGKADQSFLRHHNGQPQQLNYISRRHAHIFVKGDTPFVEDLGSKNGTSVGGKRLDEHAVPLEDGDVVAFGGNHFVYTVSLEKALEVEPTETKMAPVAPRATAQRSDPEKTTFVVAAGSFLDIFCVDEPLPQKEERNGEESKPAEPAKPEPDPHQGQGRFAILLSALAEAFGGSERGSMRRACWWAGSVAALLGIFALVVYLWGASERGIKDAYAGGDYARAVAAANRYLERNPDSAEIKALDTQALLKAGVPNWLTLLRAGDFQRASAALAGMRQLSGRNADVRPLIGDLEWMGEVEKFVTDRGGVDAPVRIYVDEDKIRALLKQWQEDAQERQRAFATIASYVPEFKDAYAEALSHLRKLQNDDSVYVAAIERLKATISAELDRDSPRALDAVLQDYSEKYPRLGGLDGVRRDLRQYIEVQNEARSRRLGRLYTLLTKVQFSTPPFQAKFRALTASDRFPPAEVLRQYGAVSEAWRQGDTNEAFARLHRMDAGPWADAVTAELQRKRALMEGYAALQRERGARDYEERLLAFYGALDADEDVYFLHGVESDVGLYRDQALARAQGSLNRAEASWRQYSEHGAIEGKERLKAAISNDFRTQAQLLSEALENVQRGARIYAQLKVARPAQWIKVEADIKAEAEGQRKSLLELRNVLEPALLKSKLALLGGDRSEDERKSP